MKTKIEIFEIIMVFVVMTSLACNFLMVYAMFSLKEDFKFGIEAITAPPLYERVAERFAEVHEYNNNASEKEIYNCLNYSNDYYIKKDFGNEKRYNHYKEAYQVVKAYLNVIK